MLQEKERNKHEARELLFNEINGVIVANSVKEAMRKKGVEIIFKEHVVEKFKHNIGIIYLDTRDAFKRKDVTPSVIKYAYSCNQCGVRDAMINGNLTGMECPRCNEIETQYHVIICKSVRQMQRDFIPNVTKELLQANKEQVDNETILDMIEDIVVHFENSNEEEHASTQQCIGMRELLRGCIVKDLRESNFNCDRHRELNKIMVVKAVIFYNEC